jgi:hypothetical protein
MKLRVIPTSVHGAIDHAVGPTLVAAPALLRLSKSSPEGLVAELTGGAAAIYSNLTDYELSMKKLIPMRLHLALDAVGGAALATVPHVTGARRRGLAHWLPHTVIGTMEVALAFLTKTEAPATKPGRLRNLLKVKR